MAIFTQIFWYSAQAHLDTMLDVPVDHARACLNIAYPTSRWVWMLRHFPNAPLSPFDCDDAALEALRNVDPLEEIFNA